MDIFACEFLGIGTGIAVWCAIGVTLESDGGHANRGTFGKLGFQIIIFWFAFGQVLPPTIIMDDDSDVIRIIEGCRGAIVGGIVELPFRRGLVPNEPVKISRVFAIAGFTAIGGEIKLVPPIQLSLWRQW